MFAYRVPSSMDCLPDEMLLHIFDCLDFVEQMAILRVSKRWNHILQMLIDKWLSENASKVSDVTMLVRTRRKRVDCHERDGKISINFNYESGNCHENLIMTSSFTAYAIKKFPNLRRVVDLHKGNRFVVKFPRNVGTRSVKSLKLS